MNDVIHALLFIVAFGAIFIGFMLAEAFVLWKRGEQGAYNFKETLASVATGASYKIMDGIVVMLIVSLLYPLLKSVGLQLNIDRSISNIVLCVILADFLMYVSHYCQHKIRWFWTAHVTHHSSTGLNLSTALRQNALIPINGVAAIQWVPMALVGVDIDMAIVLVEANLIYQFFIHTRVINKMPKWYEFIFNTPSHHRVHHGKAPLQVDTNFAGIFILWDRLFGTFQAEETAGDIIYGVNRMPKKPYNPLYLQLHEMLWLWQDVVKYKDLRILFMPPEWLANKYPSVKQGASAEDYKAALSE